MLFHKVSLGGEGTKGGPSTAELRIQSLIIGRCPEFIFTGDSEIRAYEQKREINAALQLTGPLNYGQSSTTEAYIGECPSLLGIFGLCFATISKG